jgi:hypothetical protein
MADVLDLEVVIIGAGATGLLVAQGLKLVCVVHKQSHRLSRPLSNMLIKIQLPEWHQSHSVRKRRGIHISYWTSRMGMTLHFGQEYLSKCIPPELMSRLGEACCDSFYTGKHTSWSMFNGQTGEKFLTCKVSILYGFLVASFALSLEKT